MSLEHIEVLVEEPSMEAALRLLLPRILGDVSFELYAHKCKDDLLKRLPERLRGYGKWIPVDWRILVVVDRDDEDCLKLKARMEHAAAQAGLLTRSKARGATYSVLNRIAIEELEAWYFGDWGAVRKAYPKVESGVAGQAKYRDPDAIAGGAWEAFERVMRKAGYFKSGLRKIEAAGAVAEHMTPEINKSHSFQVLRAALLEMGSQ